MSEWQQRMAWLEEQFLELERSADPATRARVQQMIQTILDLHAAGLARFLELTAANGAAGRSILDACAQDSLMGSLLLVHRLHPWSLETRIRWALDKLRSSLLAESAQVILISAGEGIARLSLHQDRPETAPRLHQMIEAAILAVAPEIERIDIEATEAAPSTLIPLPLVGERR